MARWQPGAPERLQQAALTLFTERGFEQTTAADIAESVGLTERTFYRHFSDKREVLFHGQDEFTGSFLTGLHGAPANAPPMTMVVAALQSAAALFPNDRRPYSRRRQLIIDANPPLQERERHKLAGLAVDLTAGLQERGIGELAATLAGESGMTVFSIAFAQWLRTGERRTLSTILTAVLAELSAVTVQQTASPSVL